LLSIYTKVIVKSRRETGHGKTLTRKTHNHSDNASRRRRTTRTIGALINVAALLAICLSIALTALVRFWKPVAVDDLGALVAVSAMGLVANLVSALIVESSALLHLRDDPTERAGLVRLRLRRGDKRRRGDVVAAARRVLKRFAADEHTYVEVTDAASPKSVITQSRAVSAFSGPFTGISCRPCKN
jgi:hypothetical protein